MGTLEVPFSNLYFLLFFGGDRARLPAGAHVYELEARRYSEWTRSFRIARWYRDILADIEAQGTTEIVAYVAHPFELPGNDLIYSNGLVKRRELLPDGLVNYISAPVVPSGLIGRARYAARVALRILGARGSGLHYRVLWRGQITQVQEDLYDRAWCDVAEGFYAPPCGTTLLPIHSRQTRAGVPRGTLLLDQELRELANEDLEWKLRRRFVEIAAEFANEPLFYKGHPRGQNRATAFSLEVRDVSRESRAEDLLDALALGRLVGFYSTPLLFPQDGLERIAILPELGAAGVRKPELLKQLHAVLTNGGAKIVKVR